MALLLAAMAKNFRTRPLQLATNAPRIDRINGWLDANPAK